MYSNSEKGGDSHPLNKTQKRGDGVNP